MIWGKTLYFVHPKSTLHRIWPSWLLSKDMIWGKPFCFVQPKLTMLCMSILTLEQILIWVLVLVLDMKVLGVLKYFLKKWVLDQYLYLIYIWVTWCTWVLGQLYLTPTLVSVNSLYIQVRESSNFNLKLIVCGDTLEIYIELHFQNILDVIDNGIGP